jgi:hypothetical protein
MADGDAPATGEREELIDSFSPVDLRFGSRAGEDFSIMIKERHSQ